MTPRLKLTTFGVAFIATSLTMGGVALAATPHHSNTGKHERYTEACSTLSGQWSSAASGSHAKMRQARYQERKGAQDCRSHKTAELKAGVQHYRSALRMIGVKPSI